PRPPASSCPSTTLFRSNLRMTGSKPVALPLGYTPITASAAYCSRSVAGTWGQSPEKVSGDRLVSGTRYPSHRRVPKESPVPKSRSEEHTSELQSRENLV